MKLNIKINTDKTKAEFNLNNELFEATKQRPSTSINENINSTIENTDATESLTQSTSFVKDQQPTIYEFRPHEIINKILLKFLHHFNSVDTILEQFLKCYNFCIVKIMDGTLQYICYNQLKFDNVRESEKELDRRLNEFVNENISNGRIMTNLYSNREFVEELLKTKNIFAELDNNTNSIDVYFYKHYTKLAFDNIDLIFRYKVWKNKNIIKNKLVDWTNHKILDKLLSNDCSKIFNDLSEKMKIYKLNFVGLFGNMLYYECLDNFKDEATIEQKINLGLSEFNKILTYENVNIPSSMFNKYKSKDFELIQKDMVLNVSLTFVEFYGSSEGYLTFEKELKKVQEKIDEAYYWFILDEEIDIKWCYFRIKTEYELLIDKINDFHSRCFMTDVGIQFYIMKKVARKIKMNEKEWKEKILKIIYSDFFNHFIEEEIIAVPDDLPLDVKDNNYQDIYIKISGRSNRIKIYGRKTYIKDLKKIIKENQEKQIYTEKIDAKFPLLSLLFISNYKESLEKDYRDLKIEFDIQNCKLLLKSTNYDNVMYAYNIATELLANIVTENFKCKEIQIEYIRDRENHAVNWLRINNHKAFIECSQTNAYYCIYAFSHESIKQCYKGFIDDFILYKEYITNNQTNKKKIVDFISRLNASRDETNEKKGYIHKYVQDGLNSHIYQICGSKENVEVIYMNFLKYLGIQN